MTISPGKYIARATSAELGFAGTGTEQILVHFEITQGDHTGETIAWFGSFTENTARRTIEALKYMGWKPGDWNNFEGIGANEVQLVIEEEPDNNGTLRTRVKWVNALGTGPKLKTVMDQGQTMAFANSMRGLVQEVMGATGKPAAPSRQVPAPAASPRAPSAPNGQRRAAPTYEEQHGADEEDQIPF